MPSDSWVAIDFETATPAAHSACALGVAVVEGLSVVSTASWLIQPPANEYHWACTRVHGIDEDDTAQAPTFDEVWNDVRPYLDAGRLLAHNAPFDARVLAALIERHDLEAPSLGIACTVAMARKALPALPDHKLPSVCAACGIDLPRHHEAVSDALACANVALACVDRVGAWSIGEALEGLSVPLRSVR